MVLGEGMVLVVIGGVIGVALAAAAARVLSSVLFVGPFDAGELRDRVRRAGGRGAAGERGPGAPSGAGRSDGCVAVELECAKGVKMRRMGSES